VEVPLEVGEEALLEKVLVVATLVEEEERDLRLEQKQSQPNDLQMDGIFNVADVVEN
jgi:hypothetical protein